MPHLFRDPVLTVAKQLPLGKLQAGAECSSVLSLCPSQELELRVIMPPAGEAEHSYFYSCNLPAHFGTLEAYRCREGSPFVFSLYPSFLQINTTLLSLSPSKWCTTRYYATRIQPLKTIRPLTQTLKAIKPFLQVYSWHPIITWRGKQHKSRVIGGGEQS